MNRRFLFLRKKNIFHRKKNWKDKNMYIAWLQYPLDSGWWLCIIERVDANTK